MGRMRFSPVFFLIAAFLLLLSPLEMSCRQGQPITEERVRSTLKSLDDAFLDKDVKAVAGLLSDDFSMRIIRTEVPRPSIDHFNRSEYVRRLIVSFRSSTPLSFKREGLTIEISKNGQSAKATYELHKRENRSGQLNLSVTKDTAVFGLRGGRPVIQSLHSVHL